MKQNSLKKLSTLKFAICITENNQEFILKQLYWALFLSICSSTQKFRVLNIPIVDEHAWCSLFSIWIKNLITNIGIETWTKMVYS